VEHLRSTSPPLKVVVADSDPLFRRFLKETLEKRPDYHVVGEAATGTDMVRTVSAAEPDLIVFDVQLPRLNGLDALRQIRQKAAVAAVVVTAHCDHDLLRRILAAGVLSLFIKPIEEYQFGPALRVALAQCEELRRLKAENNALHETLQNRIAIERAKGILMNHHQWSETEAIRRLQRAALAQRLKLAEIAQMVMNGGDIEMEVADAS
jgi:response regulator NasT